MCVTGAALVEADGAGIVLVIANVLKFPALSHHWRGHQIRAHYDKWLVCFNELHLRQRDYHLGIKSDEHGTWHAAHIVLWFVSGAAPTFVMHLPVCALDGEA